MKCTNATNLYGKSGVDEVQEPAVSFGAHVLHGF